MQSTNWQVLYHEKFDNPDCLKNFNFPWATSKIGDKLFGSNKVFFSGKSSARLGIYTSSDNVNRAIRLTSNHGFGYGYYEFRARFKGASGAHTALWLVSRCDQLQQPCNYQPAPLENVVGGIEIDLVEHRSQDQAGKNINEYIRPATHFNGYGTCHKSTTRTPELYKVGDPSVWRTYAVKTTPQEGIVMYVDGQEFYRCPMHTYNRQYFIMSAEVWVDSNGNATNSWSGPLLPNYGTFENPSAFVEVDYINYYGDPDFVTFEKLWNENGQNFNTALEKFRLAGKIKGYDSTQWLLETYGKIYGWEQINLCFHERISDWRMGLYKGNPSFKSGRTLFCELFNGQWLDVPKLDVLLQAGRKQGLYFTYDTAGSIMASIGIKKGDYKYIISGEQMQQIYDQFILPFWTKNKRRF